MEGVQEIGLPILEVPSIEEITEGRAQIQNLRRIEIENLFSSISDEKTNNLYRCFADLGIGRDYFAIFKKAI